MVLLRFALVVHAGKGGKIRGSSRGLEGERGEGVSC